ncbi:MAG: GNAT family N-acetyltransferase [Lachnospiraceae bacterium]|nr:GNAT family N-acetyltransferase [Lachnospiraceae bacterium]
MKRKKTSEAVEFKSVYEVLQVDEETDPEGFRPYDAKDLVEGIKVYDFMLNTVNSGLDDYVRAYEKDPSDRTTIQAAYTFKIDVLAGMAKTFRPLSAYGRDRLGEVKKCSREYASFVAPLITNITPDKAESFSKVLTEDMREDVEVGKVKALGAVRYRDGKLYGAGAIVYKVEYSPIIGGNVGRILWLYVHEDFREQGVGDHLMAELLGSMLENGIEHVTIDGLTGDEIELDRLKAYLMSSWMFDLETTLNTDALIRVGNIKNLSKFKDLVKGVKSLSELKDGENSNGVKNALKRMGRPGYLSDKLLKTDYIDPELSFYLGTETTVTALLLAHRLPSGKIRVEYLNSEDGSFEPQQKLISAFFKKTSIQCSEETLLYIPVDSAENAIFIEEICPIQLGQYMLEGLLAPRIGSDEDIDAKMVAALLEFDEDEIEELDGMIKAAKE